MKVPATDPGFSTLQIMWLDDDRLQLLLKFVIITVKSETSLSQYFQAKLEFDNLLAERTPAANVSSESILRCAIFCEKGCECFSFNLITGVCLLYDSCYPFGMTVNETGWRLFVNLSNQSKWNFWTIYCQLRRLDGHGHFKTLLISLEGELYIKIQKRTKIQQIKYIDIFFTKSWFVAKQIISQILRQL